MSNWGGYALAIAYAKQAKIPTVVSVEFERLLAEKMIELSICDGILMAPGMTVDALPFEMTESVIEDLLSY